MDFPASDTTVQLASEAVQTQERLLSNLRQRLAGANQPTDQQTAEWRVSTKVIEECKVIRDKLREIKSQAEGTAIEFESVAMACSPSATTQVNCLRQRLLQHVATDLTPDQKQKCLDLVNVIFQSYWKKLLFAAIVSCPWYVSTQSEYCRQARRNQLILVYVSKDDQFFAPVNRHVKEKNGDVLEHEGWLYAAEVFHFVHYVSKGKVRFIEALYLPDSCVLYAYEQWHELVRLSTSVNICGMSSFLEQCRGQAVGAVGRKRKKNGMVMRDTVKLNDFSESFRLLQHASTTVMTNSINVSSVVDTLPRTTDALSLLHRAYHHETDNEGDVSNYKESLFQLVMQWKSDVDDQISRFNFSEYRTVKCSLEKWLGQVRLQNIELLPVQLASPEELQRSKLVSLLHEIGGSVSKMSPEQIVLIARAGSHLYDLAKVDSDMDYVIIYADPLQKIVSATTRASESSESRGFQQTIEFGAYEVRFLAEMLWKGSVVMLELVFADDLDYCSEAWSLLTSNRNKFVTEQSILQYFGLIRNNMIAIKSEKHKGTPKELKLFYQIFHKLHCLEFLLRRQYPKIKCEGETREFIMQIRNSNPQDFPRDVILGKACDKMDSLKRAFNERTSRLPEYINYGFLLNWISSVRRVKCR